MAITVKMRAFAQAVVGGMSNKDAAISAGYSEKTAMQQGAKLAKLPGVIAHIEKLSAGKKLTSTDEKLTPPKSKPVSTIQAVKVETEYEEASGEFVGRDEIPIGSKDDPLEYLKSVWTDECQDEELRIACARAALPYVHGKVSEKGKKETRADEARNIAQGASKFATRAARKTYS